MWGAPRPLPPAASDGYHVRAMSRRLSDLMAQLPSSRPARAAVIGSLVLGAVVATSLSVLIAIFLFTAYGSP